MSRLLALAALVLCGVVVGVGLCEGLARILERQRCTTGMGGVNVRNQFYGWGNRPGASGWLWNCVQGRRQFEIHARFDRHGLRGADSSYQRADAFRILVLGDSFTAGLQVNEEDTYVRQLERRLRAAGECPVEVLNAGVNGWGTDNALLYWQQEGWRFQPDLVVLAFDTLNDVFENQRRIVGMSWFWGDKPYFTVRGGRLVRHNFPLPPENPLHTLRAAVTAHITLRSALFRMAVLPHVLDSIVIRPPAPPADGVRASWFEVYRVDEPPWWRDAWRITDRLVLGLERDVRRRGGRLAVMVIDPREEVAEQQWKVMLAINPDAHTMTLDRDKPSRHMTHLLARRGIPAIPLLEEFRAAFPDGSRAFWVADPHWTAAGHALAAEVLARRLIADGLVPQHAPCTAGRRTRHTRLRFLAM